MNEQEVRVQLDKWRGYSAYELAKLNGFNGTEEEWLESLQGGMGDITVNDKGFEEGTHKIKLYLKDIPMRDTTEKTAQDELDGKVDTDELVQDERGGKEKALSAEAGKNIAKLARSKAQILMRVVNIPAAGWEADAETDIYGQSVAVDGITANTELTGAQVAPPLNRELEAVYTSCGVRASAQGDGVIVFTALDKPDVDLMANVTVIVTEGAVE